MSYRRVNWERQRARTADRRSVGTSGRRAEYYRNTAQPFPVLRMADSRTLGLASLVSRAIDRLEELQPGSMASALVVRNGRKYDHRPAVSLIGLNEPRHFGIVQWPDDTDEFLEELADKTATSDRVISAPVIRSGIFGKTDRRDGIVTVGLTFDADTTETLRAERQASADIILPTTSERIIDQYPHLTLGRLSIAHTLRPMFKDAINGLIEDMDPVSLLPVRTSYLS